MYRMDLARVYDLRDLKDHPSSPDAYFRNFEASLSGVPQKPQIHGFSTVSPGRLATMAASGLIL
jgi:hypothetical protein